MPQETKGGLFKVPARDKAENTTSAARSIIGAEVKARDAKTERLKALRMAHEAEQPIAVEPVKKPKKAPAAGAAKKPVRAKTGR